MRQATMFNGPFWFGKDMKEQIIVIGEEFVLTNMEAKAAIVIGRSLEESRIKIKEMGKEQNFIDFMRD